MNNKNKAKRYYDNRSVCEVLSGITDNLRLIDKYEISLNDFLTDTHRALFVVCNNLKEEGLNKVEFSDVEIYAKQFDDRTYRLFFGEQNLDNKDWLAVTIDKGLNYDINTFEYYVNNIKKMSLLRAYILNGFEVEELLDLFEIDSVILEKQKETFEKMSVVQINEYFINKLTNVKRLYNGLDRENVIRAGENIREIYSKLQDAPDYGFNDLLPELTTIFRGNRKGTFNIISMDSGLGKSRNAIAKLMKLCAKEYWDDNEQTFVENPNGVNSVLYIGTELTFKEIQVPLIAFTSGVEENKIAEGRITDEEQLRIEYALGIIEEMEYYLCDEENYSMQYIHDLIEEYKDKFNIQAVMVDYLELTNAMMLEYLELTGIKGREDLVMLNASKQLKNMAREFDVYITGFTQVTEEGRKDYKVRNQSVIPNGKATVNKADSGIVGMSPTEPELKILESILKGQKELKHHNKCNLIFNIYKNRGGIHKLIKLFCYVNLGNYQIELIQATDWFFKPIEIEPTYVTFRDNKLETVSVE